MNIKKADTKWGEFDIYYEVNPPDRDTGCPGYIQITEVLVQGVDIYDDLDNIPGAIEFLEREVEEERR